MREKSNKNQGFIQIPLLAIVIASILITSAGAGVVLYKQGKLVPLIASVSQLFKGAEGTTTLEEEEIKLEEPQIEKEPEVGQEEISPSPQELEQAKLEAEKAKTEAERLKKEAEEAKQLAEEQKRQKIQEEVKEQEILEGAEVLTSPLGGNIGKNSKLTLVNSPYIVNETIQILKGVILKIEPGVVIKFNKDTGIKVGGKLLVMGEKNSTITFTLNGPHIKTATDGTITIRNYWLGIEFLDASTDAFFDDSKNYIKGSIIKYSKIEYAKKGIHLRSSSPFIAYNLIENNELGIDNYESSPKIFHNTIRNNNKYGGGVYEGGICVLRGEPIITYNDIYNNLQGLFVNVGFYDVIIQYNNIYNNSYSYKDTQGNEIKYYDLYVWEGNDVLVQNNYWGTTDVLKIDEKIYDYYDDINSGKALYKPIATSEIPDVGVQ